LLLLLYRRKVRWLVGLLLDKLWLSLLLIFIL